MPDNEFNLKTYIESWSDGYSKAKEKLISEFVEDLKEISADWYPAKSILKKWEGRIV